MMTGTKIQQFSSVLLNYLNQEEFVKLTLSNQRNKFSDLKSLIITPVMLKTGLNLKFVYRYKTRDITKNYDTEHSIQVITDAMEKDFFNADLYSLNENVKLLINPSGKSRLIRQQIEPLGPVSLSHDRKKERIIVTEQNIYLRELGVVNASWELRHEMADKYLQINRYIELLEPELRELNIEDEFHVADMGSGKGYLTFALYDYLVNRLGKKPQMTGIEYREDLVELCNQIARKAGFDSLKFLKGSIEESDLDKTDILIALHACDTATDEAIYKGITTQSRLIVCAPCCHKQIRRDFNPIDDLGGILKHGILKERQAEIVTDGIRALIMEAWGYKTKVFEFISTDHTPKNLMITGRNIGISDERREVIFSNIRSLKKLFGIKQHHLEKLLEVNI